MVTNKEQVKTYDRLLDYLGDRVIKHNAETTKMQKASEIERMFMDAFKMILQAGYHLSELDFNELLEVPRFCLVAVLLKPMMKLFKKA